MRIECAIVDGKVTVPKEWLDEYKNRTGSEADTLVFDLSDASPKVPAGAWLLKKQG